jgi:hypothetical protein
MRTVAIAALLSAMLIASVASAQSGPPSTNAPSLSETLQWLSEASEAESGDGGMHHTFGNDGKDCSVTVTETEQRRRVFGSKNRSRLQT